jgi:MerR family transcriptional regulator, light-induced transcriptional regulator
VPDSEHNLRIGELSRRAGISPELLRAWERRYGLLRPVRTSGGFRLYSAADEQRIRQMQEHLGKGISAAEAARLASAEDEPAEEALRPGLAPDASALADALDRLDEAAAQQEFDRLLGAYTIETLLGRILLPYLHMLGERWEQGTATVGQEHFASNVVRGRLLGLARGWDLGRGPRALLACVPGELHDLPLIAFGLLLRAQGFRIAFLGADTPVDTLADVAGRLRPDLVVVSATMPEHLEPHVTALAVLAREHRLALGGAGASATLAAAAGAELLDEDPCAAAAAIAA